MDSTEAHDSSTGEASPCLRAEVELGREASWDRAGDYGAGDLGNQVRAVSHSNVHFALVGVLITDRSQPFPGR